MWSVVQYKQIGRDVEREWQQRPPNRQTHSDGHRVKSPSRGSQQFNTPLQYADPEQSAPTQTYEKSREKTTEQGKITVELNGNGNPIDPQNWPLFKRARTMMILCMLVFTQVWAGACDSLDNAKASKRYHVSPVAEDVSTAMFLFGIGSGCLFVGPLSQTIGRNPVYLSFTLMYLFFILGTALSKNFAAQIVCRYFAGLTSSAVLGINGASVGDMFRPVERALWFPVIAWVNVVRTFAFHKRLIITDKLQPLYLHPSWGAGSPRMTT